MFNHPIQKHSSQFSIRCNVMYLYCIEPFSHVYKQTIKDKKIRCQQSLNDNSMERKINYALLISIRVFETHLT